MSLPDSENIATPSPAANPTPEPAAESATAAGPGDVVDHPTFRENITPDPVAEQPAPAPEPVEPLKEPVKINTDQLKDRSKAGFQWAFADEKQAYNYVKQPTREAKEEPAQQPGGKTLDGADGPDDPVNDQGDKPKTSTSPNPPAPAIPRMSLNEKNYKNMESIVNVFDFLWSLGMMAIAKGKDQKKYQAEAAEKRLVTENFVIDFNEAGKEVPPWLGKLASVGIAWGTGVKDALQDRKTNKVNRAEAEVQKSEKSRIEKEAFNFAVQEEVRRRMQELINKEKETGMEAIAEETKKTDAKPPASLTDLHNQQKEKTNKETAPKVPLTPPEKIVRFNKKKIPPQDDRGYFIIGGHKYRQFKNLNFYLVRFDGEGNEHKPPGNPRTKGK